MSDNKRTNAAVTYEREHFRVFPLSIRREYYEDVLKPATIRANTPVATYIKEAINQRVSRLKNE